MVNFRNTIWKVFGISGVLLLLLLLLACKLIIFFLCFFLMIRFVIWIVVLKTILDNTLVLSIRSFVQIAPMNCSIG